MSETNSSCHLCLNETFDETELIQTKCNHQFCLKCLSEYLENNLECFIKCPMESCNEKVSDAIIRKLLDENVIDEYEKLCMAQCKNCHRCLLPECGNFVSYSDKNSKYTCSNCTLFNCIMCNAAHKSLSCNEYRSNTATKGKIACRDELERAKGVFKIKSAQSMRKTIAEAMKKAVLPNTKIFTCEICNVIIHKGLGVQLKNCFHLFCRDCLTGHIKNSTEIPVPCPDVSCKFRLYDSESRELLSDEDLTIYEDKIMRIAMPSLSGGFHCKSPNCRNCVDTTGFKFAKWTCNLCKSVNCIKCEAIHRAESCDEYQSAEKKFIQDQIKDKKLMECPKCKNLIQKTRGCNWIKCSSCNTELCWILQTYRWGPNGRGDTSGGCRCMEDGKFCHPDCRGCIPDDPHAAQVSDDEILHLLHFIFRMRFEELLNRIVADQLLPDFADSDNEPDSIPDNSLLATSPSNPRLGNIIRNPQPGNVTAIPQPGNTPAKPQIGNVTAKPQPGNTPAKPQIANIPKQPQPVGAKKNDAKQQCSVM